jgi:hypothetical protein
MPGGRPTKYSPEVCQIAIDFLENASGITGKSRIQLCRHLRIAKSTMQLWEKTYPEFSAAIEQGLTYSEARWEDLAEENLSNKDFSCRMYELQVMNRFGWARKIQNENNTTLGAQQSIMEILNKQ